MTSDEFSILMRVSVAVGLLLLILALEAWKPFREKRHLSLLSQRWWHNMSFVFINTSFSLVLIRLSQWFLPLLPPLWAAHWAEMEGVGVLNWLEWQGLPAIIIAFLFLDFGIYWQHRWMHEVPFLWRLHKMHHSDEHLDLSSGLRFHPFEIGLSLIFKSILVLLVGAPAVAVIVFDIVLNGMAMFNHSNTVFPKKIEQMLRAVLVTPQMHRIHHSAEFSGNSHEL